MLVRLAKIHILLQFLDGSLTYIGVKSHGNHLEANPLLYWLMEQLGPGPTLFFMKSFAIGVICAVIYHKDYLESFEMKLALWAINLVYFFAAIVPWVIFLVKPSFFTCVNIG